MVIDTIASYQGDKTTTFEAIKAPVLGYVLVWITMALNFRIADWVKMRFLPNIRRDMITRMFAYLNRHSYSYMQHHFAGNLSNKIMDMAGSTASALTRVDEAAANIFAFFIALGAMYFVNPLFSAILLIWAFSFIGITVWFSKKTKILSKDFSESKSTLSDHIVDALSNLINMRLFARNTYENTRLNAAVTDTVTKDRAVQWQIMKMRIWWDITFIALITSMLGGLVYLYSHGKITVGDFAFIMTVSMNIFMHVWGIASQFVQFAEDLGKCSQALATIMVPHDVVDVPDAQPLTVKKGAITFDHVTFRYQRNNNLFEDKHLDIEAGTKVGLVGFSGSGKTTFVNLILRFFDIESGQILIDGQDIAKVTQDSLHEQISMIPQETSLFHRSVMENIRYGRLDATDEEVREASRRAHCHAFIEQLPEGYDALVGERGIKLSGGQRQRIAIARAMLKNAPLLILDEATSALDSVTEKQIQKGLSQLMEGRTTLIIAHRLSTLSRMDRILVFDHGQIVEDGTHHDLLLKNGQYARMWTMQAGGFLPERDI